MDSRFISPFVKSIGNTFETLCGLPVTVRPAQMKTGPGPAADVSIIIGFSGDAEGSLSLHFSSALASRLATNVSGFDITVDHDDFADALGQIATIVACGAQTRLGGLAMSISLPTVIVGSNHLRAGSRTLPRILLPCDTELGSFAVEMAMSRVPQRTDIVAEAVGVFS